MKLSWIFRCYVDGDGIDVIDAWYGSQDDVVQAKFDTRVRFLQQQPRDKWKRLGFDTYKDGVGYIRMDIGNVQHRVFGCPMGQLEYAWLIAATKKGKAFSPRGADETAVERMAEVVAERERSRDCEFE
jgi:hypothetical protein